MNIKGGTCNEITWYVDFINDLWLDLFGAEYGLGTWNGPKLAGGCIGSTPDGGAASPTTSEVKVPMSTFTPPPAPVPLPKLGKGCPLLNNAVPYAGFDDMTIEETQTVGA
jgi:hypothetical protein